MPTLCITFTRHLVCLILDRYLDIDSFAAIKDLQNPSTDLLEEFQDLKKYL